MELLPSKEEFDISHEDVPLWPHIDEDSYGDSASALSCPHCGAGYLHHYGFTVYDRTEDNKITKTIDAGNVAFEKDGTMAYALGMNHTEGSGLTIKEELSDHRNPSLRRDGIVIKFWCENCHGISLLTIAQHKGFTFTSWRKIKAELKKKKRKAIKPGLRFDVLKRDNYKCQACGSTPQEGAILEIDHIVPFSKCGTDDMTNLQVLCRDCNLGKGNKEQ